MADFTTLYSGKGLATQLPSDGGKAMGRLSDFITKAEEIKYNAFKETQDWFVKSQDVDPVVFLTTANQIAQDKLLKTYNEESSAILKASNNNLSTEDRAKIIAGKNVLLSEQQKMQSDMEQALIEKEIVDKDMGVNYDQTEWFQQKWQPYLESGKYDKTPLQPKAKPIEEVFKGKVTGASAYEEVDTENPLRMKISSADKKTVAPRVADVIFSNPAVKRHALEEWDSRSAEEKESYLNDLNGDHIITEEERRSGDVLTKSLDNPIIKAYVDRHWGNLVDVKFVNKPKPPNKNLGITIKIGGKDNVPVPVGIKRTVDVNYGGISRPNMYNLGGTTPLTDVPTTGGVMLEEGGLGAKTEGGNYAKAYLKDYDADRKTLIVQITTSDPISGTERLQLVEIPEKNITDYQNIHLMVDGKETTIGDLEGRQGTTAPTTTTSGVNWK